MTSPVKNVADSIMSWLVQSKIVSSLLFTLLGGAVGTVYMRFIQSDKITKNATDIQALFHDDTSFAVTLKRIDERTNILLKAKCSDWTLQEQDMYGVLCPPNLYKGAIK